jgi:hypothetical protein
MTETYHIASHDYAVEYAFRSWESFARPVRWVETGKLRIGGKEKPFLSEGFCTCSAFIMQNSSKDLFGLMHVAPGQHISDQQIRTLDNFKDGDLVIVEGTLAQPKPFALRLFESRLNISNPRIINLNDETEESEHERALNQLFSVVFRPETDEIIVDRSAWTKEELLIFKGFNVASRE